MSADLELLVQSAVDGFFGTMLGMQMKPVVCSPTTAVFNGEPTVAGSVGLVGRFTGVLYVHTSLRFARRITAGLLGMSEAEVEGDAMIHDAVGEMANMVVGQIKSTLCDRGMSCALTVPSVVRGRKLQIQAVSSTQLLTRVFESDGHQVCIELLVGPWQQNAGAGSA